jgi:hypothetical protein
LAGGRCVQDLPGGGAVAAGDAARVDACSRSLALLESLEQPYLGFELDPRRGVSFGVRRNHPYGRLHAGMDDAKEAEATFAGECNGPGLPLVEDARVSVALTVKGDREGFVRGKRNHWVEDQLGRARGWSRAGRRND